MGESPGRDPTRHNPPTTMDSWLLQLTKVELVSENSIREGRTLTSSVGPSREWDLSTRAGPCSRKDPTHQGGTLLTRLGSGIIIEIKLWGEIRSFCVVAANPSNQISFLECWIFKN